jgi:hypothetical protein
MSAVPFSSGPQREKGLLVLEGPYVCNIAEPFSSFVTKL